MGNQFIDNVVISAGKIVNSATQFLRDKLYFFNPMHSIDSERFQSTLGSMRVAADPVDSSLHVEDSMQTRLFSHKLKRNIPEVANDDAHFLTDSFTNFAGTLQYRLFVPSCYHGQSLPLVVMLHGCKQDADIFATSTQMNHVAERAGCFVLYPQQIRFANTGKCWTWYKTINQLRDSGEPAVISDMTKKVIKSYAINADKVYIAGLSSGASMAYIIGLAYPELYAAIGVHSGLLFRGVRNIFSAFATMKQGSAVGTWPESELAEGCALSATPLIVFHGDQDSVVNPKNADELVAYHQNGRIYHEVKQNKSVSGHDCTRIVFKQEDGVVFLEQWMIHGAGHAWSGGNEEGSYADAKGPNASEEMLRFFLSRNRSVNNVDNTPKNKMENRM